MATIDDAVQAVKTLITNVTGIRSVEDYPSNILKSGLDCKVYCPEAVWGWSDFREVRPIGTIRVHLLYTPVDMARAVKALAPYADSIPKAIMAASTLSATVLGYQGVAVHMDPFSWETLGYAELVIDIQGVEWIPQSA